MNEFESTLASALQAEADRTTRHLDAPDAARRLEAGFDRIDRDRRHRTWATALTAAAAVLFAGGVYGVTRIDSPTSGEPSKSPSSTTQTRSTTTTQAYQMYAGHDAKGVAFHAEVALDDLWGADTFPVISEGTRRGGLAVYEPLALAAGTGCLSDNPNRQVGQTPQKLAQQLAHLPRSTVLQPPTPMQRFGRHAIHMRLRINPDCGKSVYRVAETLSGDHGISYGKPSIHVVIDFWVEKVRGVPVVVETWHQDGASSQMLNEIADAVKSLTFKTDE